MVSGERPVGAKWVGEPRSLHAPLHRPPLSVKSASGYCRSVQWLCLILFFSGAIAFAQPDDEIRRILSDRIERDHQSLGMVVGIIDGDGRRIVAQGDVRPDSLFEIGSITKVFTALLLADMAERGEVALSDPVTKYLPDGVKAPQRGRPMTLEDLSTHMSGLPRLPTNLSPRTLANPYVDYTPAKLYDFLGSYKLERESGAKWEYSNLAAGLLGHLLARRAGMDYDTMVRLRICGPLGMTSTVGVMPPELRPRAATGHNALLQPVRNWDWDALAGAGALWSSASDMLDFVDANLGKKKSGLAPAMAAMLKVRYPIGGNVGQALGWQTFTRDGVELFWKDGGTFGFASFVGFDPKSGRGVVVLSDAFTLPGVSDIGMHLLDARNPLRGFGGATKSQ
jgi:D-alanyl-D-alanine-carboxypeptidase/D-alanyl-D-alanine-endopeptidase